MRPNGWEGRLAREFADASRRDFEYGRHDCATFANKCVLAINGTSAWSVDFGRYGSEAGAARAIRRAGGLVVGLDRHAPRVALNDASRGDLALIETPKGPAVGVIDGRNILIAADPTGLAVVPRSCATIAWKV